MKKLIIIFCVFLLVFALTFFFADDFIYQSNLNFYEIREGEILEIQETNYKLSYTADDNLNARVVLTDKLSNKFLISENIPDSFAVSRYQDYKILFLLYDSNYPGISFNIYIIKEESIYFAQEVSDFENSLVFYKRDNKSYIENIEAPTEISPIYTSGCRYPRIYDLSILIVRCEGSWIDSTIIPDLLGTRLVSTIQIDINNLSKEIEPKETK